MVKPDLISHRLDIQNFGEIVLDENGKIAEGWEKPPITFNDGYIARREVMPNNGADEAVWREVTCSIAKSGRGHPLFKCAIEEDWQITATNPTTSLRKTLAFLNSSVKGKLNGYRFFGLQSKKYEILFDQIGTYADLLNSSTDTLNNSTTETSIVTHSVWERSCSWIDVVSYGALYNSPEYEKQCGRSTIRLQPGYHAIRKVAVEGDQYTEVEMHCTIEQSDDGPLFCISISDSQSFKSH